jgi:hypothetical protein
MFSLIKNNDRLGGIQWNTHWIPGVEPGCQIVSLLMKLVLELMLHISMKFSIIQHYELNSISPKQKPWHMGCNPVKYRPIPGVEPTDRHWKFKVGFTIRVYVSMKFSIIKC